MNRIRSLQTIVNLVIHGQFPIFIPIILTNSFFDKSKGIMKRDRVYERVAPNIDPEIRSERLNMKIVFLQAATNCFLFYFLSHSVSSLDQSLGVNVHLRVPSHT